MLANDGTETNPLLGSPLRSQAPILWDGKTPLAATESVLLHLDGTVVTEKVIGEGGSGIVIEKGQYAVKLPKLSREVKVYGVPVEMRPLTLEGDDYDERPPLIQSIELEKAIYQKLGNHYGIVRCHNVESTEISIRMDRMNGDLRHYLVDHKPDKKTRLSWLKTLAHTLAYIHEHRIIVSDIRLDNLLLDDTLAVKFCDFGESALMPLDWDVNGTDEFGFSFCTDIAQFGTAMYEIITGFKCRFDLNNVLEDGESYFTACPPRETLPSTEHIWLGHIIDKCWTEEFKSAHELAIQLDQEGGP